MVEALPGVLGRIAAVAGEVAALSLAAQAGGRKIYVPEKITQAHWLAAAIGLQAAEKLCQHFGGEDLRIPLYVNGTYKAFMRALAERVHKLDLDKASSSEIARKLGITQRSVHRHRARHHRSSRGDRKQGRLL